MVHILGIERYISISGFLRVSLKYRCGQHYNRIGRMFMKALLISSVGISGIYMKRIKYHCR